MKPPNIQKVSAIFMESRIIHGPESAPLGQSPTLAITSVMDKIARSGPRFDTADEVCIGKSTRNPCIETLESDKIAT